MSVTNPLGKAVTYTYTALGNLEEEAGDAGYKVTYGYDEYGVKNKMWTWRNASTSDLTEWIYQPGTGLLLQKKDAAGKGFTNTYSNAGRVATLTSARGIVTTYAYDTVTGDLTGIDYSDSTPDVTLSGHDRLGRPGSISQSGIGSETLTYHPGRTAEFERYYSSGHILLPGIGIRHTAPDAHERPTGFIETSGANTTAVRTVGYGYSASSGLLSTITDGGQNHTYAYHPNSSLVSTIHSNSGSTAWFRESRYYDSGARLVGIKSDRMNGSSVLAPISSYAYDHDALGRRVGTTLQDGSSWEYDYNDRSEVTEAIRKTPGGTEVSELGATYSYDGIGNRLTSNSPVLGNRTYTPNGLNQYASITTGSNRTAVGRAPVDWNILVAGMAAGRTGEIFHRELSASNASAPVWQDVVVQKDTGTPTFTQHFWYAQQNTSPVHDDDGNLTNDGRWTYIWDAENRLIQMETTSEATTAGHPYTKLQFAYDWQGRRLARHVWQGGDSGSPMFKSSHRWLSHGWRQIVEFSSPAASSGTLTRSSIFTWGSDLSDKDGVPRHRAGGVGGLISNCHVSSSDVYAASCDGNGNIVAWTSSALSAPTSRQEYDPSGNVVASEGVAPSLFGFSTKMRDAESNLLYFGYRFYDPIHGRWSSRDPLAEKGGVNLYVAVDNSFPNLFDVIGLQAEKPVRKPDGNDVPEGAVGRFEQEYKDSDVDTDDEECTFKFTYNGWSRIHYKDGVDKTVKGPTGLTLTAEEEKHREIFEAEVEVLRAAVNPLEGKYKDAFCAQQAAKVYNAHKEAYYANFLAKELAFELSTRAPETVTAADRENLKAYQERAKGATERAQQAQERFTNSFKCAVISQ